MAENTYENNLQTLAFLAKCLADENRLRILFCVSKGKKSVSRIVEELKLSQPLVSHHLKELKRSLFVSVERRGPFVYYELSDERILSILEKLNELGDDLLKARTSFWPRRMSVVMAGIEEIIDSMEPEDALAAIAAVANKLLTQISDEARLDFVVSLIGDSGVDKISSMVNLWLAECMDEGVDPTSMCQSLVHKVAQSKQLMAVADPDILILFESWLDELEEEVLGFLKKNQDAGPQELAANLGISKSGASFLLAKLTRKKWVTGGHMAILTVFHSGNPAWATCKKAIGVATEMKDKYGENLEIKIFTTDSEEAKSYNFRSSTNVLFNEELIPLDVATDRNRLDLFLSENL